MSLFSLPEFKVGLLFLGVAGAVGYMSMQVTSDPSTWGRTHKAYFILPSAAGLIKNSPVKTAGISVGVIKNISLIDGQARVDITVQRDVGLKVSAAVEIRSQGILGDQHVELYPGTEGDPPLPEGGQIVNVKSSGSLDSVVGKIGGIADSLGDVATALQEAVKGDGTNKHILGRIVQNIEKLTADIAQITGENKEQIAEIVDQVNSITKTLDELMTKEGDGSVKAAVRRLDASLKNIEEITDKINKGEGTIGRLVNDESTVDGLNEAIEGVGSFLDTANKTETAIDFHTEYLGKLGAYRSAIGLKIQPGLDRYYFIQIVDDPDGVTEETDTKTTTGGTVTEVNEVKKYRSKTKFSVQFAKVFWDLTVRGGLIDNAGGFGVDYDFFLKKLKFTIEAFDFGKTNVRAALTYNFYHGIYVKAGGNDLLNKSGRTSAYVGAGILLTNDDLKMIVSKLPGF
ncbi:MAG: MlaD family protein [Pseudobdellovibrionaceae bacterium]